MTKQRIIDAGEIVKPSTRPNPRLTYYELYRARDVHYSLYSTNKSNDPSLIDRLESENAMRKFDNL